MNIKRWHIVWFAIIVKWDFCFGKIYQLKEYSQSVMTVRNLQENTAMWDLLSKTLQYEGFITVIIGSFIEYDITWHADFVHLLHEKLCRPVAVMEIKDFSKPMTDYQEVRQNFRNSNTSYILLVGDVRVISLFFHEVKIRDAMWNINAPFVIMTPDENLAEIHEVFRKMWRFYGVNKMIAMHHERSRRVTAYDYINDFTQKFDIANIEEILQYCCNVERKLNGYRLIVAMHEDPPTAIALPNATGFRGLDWMIIDTLRERMNFTMKLYQENSHKNFVELGKNVTPENNTLLRVMHREIDIAANLRFIRSYEIDGIEFTTPCFSDGIHFIVPKAGRVPLWLSMYQIFEDEIWLVTAYLSAVSVVLWLFIFKLHSKWRLRENVATVIIDVLFLLTGRTIARQINKTSARLLTISGLIFGLIMTNCFTGQLYKRFSGVTYYPDIEDLKELKESGLPIELGSHGALAALQGTEDALLKSLIEKVDEHKVLTGFNVENGVVNYAILARLSRARYEMSNIFIKNNGTEMFHLVQKPLGRFGLAYAVPRGWAFLDTFNAHVSTLLEAGLLKKWYEDTMWNTTLWALRIRYSSFDKVPWAFNRSDLKLAWYTSIIGLVISLVTFLIEIVCRSRVVKRLKLIYAKLKGAMNRYHR